MSVNGIARLSDAELIDVVKQTFQVINGNLSVYTGITQAQIDELNSKNSEFSGALTAHVAAQAAARSQTLAKNALRQEVEQLLRTLRNVLILNKVAESDISALSIPVSAGDLPTNATRPTGTIDTSERLRHLIRFADESEPDKKRRPRGVMGCEIWLKLDGAPPADETVCNLLGVDRETPYLKEFSGAEAGKMAHYMLRWIFNDGSHSAWSETISGTVTG